MEAQRVQTLAATSLTNNTIPTEFIRPENEQPCNTTYNGQVTEIPTVDFSNQKQEHLVQEIKKASTEWGIFQIVNHGVPSDLMDKLQDVGKEFFESPQEEKEKIARAPSAKSIEGYGSIVSKDPQSKKAWADHLFHRVWPPSRINYEFWPKQPPYREVNEEYAKCMNVVADKLFKYLSLGLGLEGNKLKEAVGGEDLEYMLKINYYPPCPRPDLALGLVAHTDLSALTLLVPNEVPGLQVFKDDHWFNASYIPNAIIVHIGDQIEILSNGKYKSVLHRTTVSKDKTRMSWPMFLEPPAEMEVGPLPELINQNDPSKYKTKKFKAYAFCKLNKLPQ